MASSSHHSLTPSYSHPLVTVLHTHSTNTQTMSNNENTLDKVVKVFSGAQQTQAIESVT